MLQHFFIIEPGKTKSLSKGREVKVLFVGVLILAYPNTVGKDRKTRNWPSKIQNHNKDVRQERNDNAKHYINLTTRVKSETVSSFPVM